jgi:hypothetical protein
MDGRGQARRRPSVRGVRRKRPLPLPQGDADVVAPGDPRTTRPGQGLPWTLPRAVPRSTLPHRSISTHRPPPAAPADRRLPSPPGRAGASGESVEPPLGRRRRAREARSELARAGPERARLDRVRAARSTASDAPGKPVARRRGSVDRPTGPGPRRRTGGRPITGGGTGGANHVAPGFGGVSRDRLRFGARQDLPGMRMLGGMAGGARREAGSDRFAPSAPEHGTRRSRP